MSFADYQRLVLQEYERKRDAGDLSRRMVRLTAAKFKEECEAVCSQRYDRKDEKTLEEFFGPGGGGKVAWLSTIKQFDPDKFKPLVNFLKGKTRWPDEKVIELLAWLIDFKPRPHELGRIYDTVSHVNPASAQDEEANDNDEKEQEVGVEEAVQVREKDMSILGNSAKRAPGFGKKIIIIAVILVTVVMAGIYWVWPKSSTLAETERQVCMYWTGDHYKQVSCSQKLGDTLIIPLDHEKLVHFKKITRPDTITENALGSIWYVKFHGVYECYTSPGYHPIDTGLQLKLLTDYVLIKHIHPSQGTEKTSQ